MTAAHSQAAVIAFLADPATHGGAAVTRFDTHGAIVFLAGDRAYKLKRAVQFGYMDFSTIERRREACAAELRLNRRTAPVLYLSVIPVTQGPDGLALDGSGDVVDWLVVMRRFDNDERLDHILSSVTPDEMRALATAIFRFHTKAPVHRREDPVGHIQGIADMAMSELRRQAGVFAPAQVDILAGALQAGLDRGADLIAARNAGGQVRRLHGDLHLANICRIDGVLTLYDALEFNDDLAIIDRLYDLAFLLMDLQQHGQAGLSNVVFNAYLQTDEDDEAVQLLPFFMMLRAAIRAHVCATRAAMADDGEAAGHRRAAEGYFVRAQQLGQPVPAHLLAVGGYSGTGKSTVARALAPGIGPSPGAVVLRSDEIRKSLFDVSHTERLPPEAYRPEISQRVYEILYRRAESILRTGMGVVADALFLRPQDRAAIEAVAARAGVPFRGLWLTAPYDVLAARVAARRNDASDATVAVLQRQMETPPGAMTWYTLDASLRRDDVLNKARAAAK